MKGLGKPAPIEAPKNLGVNGLYRFVRNPMYVGVFLLITSRAVLFWSFPVVLYLVLVATNFARVRFFIPHDEQLKGVLPARAAVDPPTSLYAMTTAYRLR